MNRQRIENRVSELWGALSGPGVSSAGRLGLMLRLLSREQNAEIFWRTFLGAWPICDDTWRHGRALLLAMERHAAKASHTKFLDTKALAFLNSLPEAVTVYRGCTRSRVRGISWTTDRTVAAGFAAGHRGICVRDPVVTSATINRAEIMAVFIARRESEILLNPNRLRHIAIS